MSRAELDRKVWELVASTGFPPGRCYLEGSSFRYLGGPHGVERREFRITVRDTTQRDLDDLREKLATEAARWRIEQTERKHGVGFGQ